MTVPGALPPDLFTALAVIFLLLGVPLILFTLIMLYTGYVRYDAEQYLEELENERDEEGERKEQGARAERASVEGERERAEGERSETATNSATDPVDRHSPATSEEGVVGDSDDGSAESDVDDDSRSP